jgi:hypothetical protein
MPESVDMGGTPGHRFLLSLILEVFYRAEQSVIFKETLHEWSILYEPCINPI